MQKKKKIVKIISIEKKKKIEKKNKKMEMSGVSENVPQKSIARQDWQNIRTLGLSHYRGNYDDEK